MSEVRLPHETLFDDSYWTRDHDDAIHGLRGASWILEGVYGVYFRHLTASSVINSYNNASKSGYDPDQIKNGQRLPTLARNDGLVKAIEDSKKAIPLDKLSKADHRFIDSDDEFDEIAAEILSNNLYQGEAANLVHIDQETSRAIKVSRTATYLTGSITSKILVGLRSELISGKRDFETTNFMHRVLVGGVYRDGDDADSRTKVIRADILVPGKKSRSLAKARSKAKVKLSPSFG